MLCVNESKASAAGDFLIEYVCVLLPAVEPNLSPLTQWNKPSALLP